MSHLIYIIAFLAHFLLCKPLFITGKSGITFIIKYTSFQPRHSKLFPNWQKMVTCQNYHPQGPWWKDHHIQHQIVESLLLYPDSEFNLPCLNVELKTQETSWSWVHLGIFFYHLATWDHVHRKCFPKHVFFIKHSAKWFSLAKSSIRNNNVSLWRIWFQK